MVAGLVGGVLRLAVLLGIRSAPWAAQEGGNLPGRQMRLTWMRRCSLLGVAASGQRSAYLAAAVALTSLLLGCCAAAGSSGPSVPGSAPTAPTAAGPAARRNPSVIAVVDQQRLELIHAATGKVVRGLAGAVGAVSLSPDGRQVYFERTNGHLDPFPIDRTATTAGPVTPVADGQQPAVSPDGTRLAYEAGNGHAVIVETLATRHRRTIDLARLAGPGARFNNTPNALVWLSDHQLVAIPPQDGTLTGGATATTVAAPPGSCTAVYNQRRQCAIVIDLDAAKPARALTLPLPKSYNIETAGPGPVAGQLLVGGGAASPSIVRFAVTDTTAARTGTITMAGRPLVVGFSPTGRQVLYLRNHGPVQLWLGQIGTTAVTPTAELIANADLGTVSW